MIKTKKQLEIELKQLKSDCKVLQKSLDEALLSNKQLTDACESGEHRISLKNSTIDYLKSELKEEKIMHNTTREYVQETKRIHKLEIRNAKMKILVYQSLLGISAVACTCAFLIIP